MSFARISQAKQAQRVIEDGLEALEALESDPRVRGSPQEWNSLLDEMNAFVVSTVPFDSVFVFVFVFLADHAS